jgi:hypothetical protein
MPLDIDETGTIPATSIHRVLTGALASGAALMDESAEPDDLARPRSGTQSLERAIGLLRELASRNRAG